MLDVPPPSDYQVLSNPEQEALCQEILAEIASGKFKPAGKAGRQHWNEVWRRDRIVPAYLRPNQVLRINRQFVRPAYPELELAWYQNFRETVLKTYFQEVPAIYEFGCGNGWNLRAARLLYPEKKLMGLDWAEQAVWHVNQSYSGDGWRISARRFDFFKLDYDVKLPPGTGVWTVGALEQTGTGWEPFLEYLLTNKPAISVHLEPILEWYDLKNSVDQTAIAYHQARDYWQGFPAQMEYLAARGKVEILEQRRSYFGSKYIEGYSLFCWRPV